MENQISFTNFDKNNKEHILALKTILKDEEIINRFQGILPLLNKQDSQIFDRGFWVTFNNQIVGYLDVGKYNKEEDCVYLRAAIFSEHRNKHLGTMMLQNACDLIFLNYPFISKIKLKIAQNNIASQKVAGNAGFTWEKDDYYYLDNPNIIKSNSSIKKTSF